MRLRNIVSWTFLVGLIGGMYLVVANAQDIRDWYALRGYEPPARVVQLADKTTMTPDTRRVFYVNHPQISDKRDFRAHCEIKEQSIVLGCYISNRGIFVLEVEDKRLDGVVEVTAAHEVLHAAYDRLSSSEKTRVDKMTNSFFKTIKDQRILDTVENYRKKDASVVPNELHSILATEVKELPADLEEYYGQYFADRQQIVEFSQQYEQAFIRLENKVESIDGQLDSLKNQIESNKASFNQKEAELNQRRTELDRLLANNQVDEYNAKVGEFNELVGSYNRLINSTKQLVSRYNQLVEERNSLVTAEQELKDAIDSSSIPSEKAR